MSGSSDDTKPFVATPEQAEREPVSDSAGAPTSVWEALGWRLTEEVGGIPCLELPDLRQPRGTR